MNRGRSRIPLLALLSLLLAIPACRAETPPLPEPFRDRPLHPLSRGGIDAVATLIRLEDHRRWDDAEFRRMAADPDEEVRRRTALAAGRIAHRDAVPLLLHLLADPSPLVRAEAAFALGQVGDSARAVVDALRAAAPDDWSPVREADATVVVEVVAALAKLGSDPARVAVVEALRRVHPAPGVQTQRIAAEALLAVWRFPSGPGRVTSALSFIGHPEPEIRWRSAYALMRMNDPAATQGLVRVMTRDEPEHRVRVHAIRGLTAARADSAGVRTEAEAIVARAIADPHPHVRATALRTAVTYDADDFRAAIVDRLRDRDVNVAIAAAGALAAAGPAGATALTALVRDARAPIGARAAALQHLAPLLPDTAARIADDWAGDDFHHRYGAARAVAGLGPDRAAPLLARLASDDDSRVAIAALDAAGTLAAADGLSPAARTALRDLLIPALQSADPRIRTVALRSLGPIADEAEVTGWRAAAGIEPERADPPDDPDHYRALVRSWVAPVLAGERRPQARIETDHGRIVVELLADETPRTVDNFVRLAEAGFYDGGVWHRVVPAFVLQDGAPAGDPTGGPGWTIRDEANRHRYGRGDLGTAHAGPHTAGSQWFITHLAQPHLDGGYTIFGRVINGEAAADRVVQGDVVRSITIVRGR